MSATAVYTKVRERKAIVCVTGKTARVYFNEKRDYVTVWKTTAVAANNFIRDLWIEEEDFIEDFEILPADDPQLHHLSEFEKNMGHPGKLWF